jgi:DTW domain-containing protein YfiP
MNAPILNKVEVVVLRHPQEQDIALGTAPLLLQLLKNSTVRTGLSWPNSEAAIGKKIDNKKWLVLYLGAAHISAKKILTFVDKKGEEIADDSEIRRSIQGIVVLDGTWSQAKALWWRNAWLLKIKQSSFDPLCSVALRKAAERAEAGKRIDP